MLLNMSSSTSMLLAMVSFASLVSSHLVLTYPGWRGDNLLSNGSIEESSGLGVGPNNSYPFGMQWIYPCESSDLVLITHKITDLSQAADLQCLIIERNGPSEVVRLLSSLVGLQATRMHYSISIWARGTIHETILCLSCPFLPSVDRTTSPTQVMKSASLSYLFRTTMSPMSAIMPRSRSSCLLSTERHSTAYVTCHSCYIFVD